MSGRARRTGFVVLAAAITAACGLDVVGGLVAEPLPGRDADAPGFDATTDDDAATPPPDDASADATDATDAGDAADALLDADAGCLAPAPNMVSWWPGDGNLVDRAGVNNGASGTQSGASAVTFGVGHVGQAFALGGTSYVQVPNASSLQITSAITMEAWVNATAFGGRIVDKITAGTADGYMLDTYQSRLRIIIGAATVSSPATLPTNTWVHVAGTWDGTTARLYVDGASVASVAAATLPSNSLAVRLGGDSTGASRLAGTLDEVAIYNRALTQAEIAAIVSAGPAGRCK